MPTNKTLIILRSVSGAGKSTLANTLKGLGAFNAEADHYFIDRNGNYEFNADELHLAHSYCKYLVEREMINNNPLVVVSNTSTTTKKLKPYIELAKKYGYTYFSLIVENRNDTKSIHNVPESILALQEVKLRGSIKLR